ncbi:MAG TPA: helix-turn-helix domain-containing protein [Chloroflexota bacterium]|nr:helix-turn-helix domain-containing protein [Chloroflexota bacterium]
MIDLVRGALRNRSDVVAENLLLRQQLMVLTRPTRKRPRLAGHDKLFWIVVRRLLPDWRRHLVLVQPGTVVRWHAPAWRLWWRWRSRCRLGRPRVSAEVRELIAAMARDNPSWGASGASS